jgi:hypothetical protein
LGGVDARIVQLKGLDQAGREPVAKDNRLSGSILAGDNTMNRHSLSKRMDRLLGMDGPMRDVAFGRAAISGAYPKKAAGHPGWRGVILPDGARPVWLLPDLPLP